jgi:ABC-type glycerol-3-phosphate transport system substrate-binding protein
MITRRTFLAGSAAATLAAARPSPAQSKVVEIEFLHIHGGLQQQTVQKQIETFNQMQPRVRVKELFVQGSYEGAVEKLQAMNAAGQAPAVAQGGLIYHKFYTGSFPITPVQKFIEADRFDVSDFAPAMLSLGTDDKGVQWGLPYAVSTPIFYYNEQAYREAGLDLTKPPATWPDVTETARALVKGDRAGVWYHYDITLPPAEVSVHPSSEHNWQHELYLLCDNIDAFISEVRKHSVPCGPVQDEGWGLLTRVTLPGGGSLGVYQPQHERPAPTSLE